MFVVVDRTITPPRTRIVPGSPMFATGAPSCHEQKPMFSERPVVTPANPAPRPSSETPRAPQERASCAPHPLTAKARRPRGARRTAPLRVVRLALTNRLAIEQRVGLPLCGGATLLYEGQTSTKGRSTTLIPRGTRACARYVRCVLGDRRSFDVRCVIAHQNVKRSWAVGGGRWGAFGGACRLGGGAAAAAAALGLGFRLGGRVGLSVYVSLSGRVGLGGRVGLSVHVSLSGRVSLGGRVGVGDGGG